MVVPTERENSLPARNGGPTWPEDRFLSHVTWAQGWNPPTSPVPPFLLAQSLSPKDIAGSDITSWKLYDANMRLAYNRLMQAI